MTDSKNQFSAISKVSEQEEDSSGYLPHCVVISEDRSIVGDLLRTDVHKEWPTNSSAENAFLLNMCSTAYDQDERVATLFDEYGMSEVQIPVASSDPLSRATGMTCNVEGKRNVTVRTDQTSIPFRRAGKSFLNSGIWILIEIPALYAWKPEQIRVHSAVDMSLRPSRASTDTHYAVGSWMQRGSEIHLGDSDILTFTLDLIPNDPERYRSQPFALVRRDVVYRPKRGAAPRMCLTMLALECNKTTKASPVTVCQNAPNKARIASDALSSSFAKLAPDIETHFLEIGGSTGKAGKQLLSSIASAIDSLSYLI